MFKVTYKHDYSGSQTLTLGTYETLANAQSARKNLSSSDDHVYSITTKFLKNGRWVKLHTLPAGTAAA